MIEVRITREEKVLIRMALKAELTRLTKWYVEEGEKKPWLKDIKKIQELLDITFKLNKSDNNEQKQQHHERDARRST